MNYKFWIQSTIKDIKVEMFFWFCVLVSSNSTCIPVKCFLVATKCELFLSITQIIINIILIIKILNFLHMET